MPKQIGTHERTIRNVDQKRLEPTGIETIESLVYGHLLDQQPHTDFLELLLKHQGNPLMCSVDKHTSELKGANRFRSVLDPRDHIAERPVMRPHRTFRGRAMSPQCIFD